VAELDGALLNGIEGLEGGHDVAGREHADVELAVGELAHALGEELAAAVDRLQALRKARRQPPAERGLRLGDRGRRESAAGGEREPRRKDVPTFHDGFPLGRSLGRPGLPGNLASSHCTLHVHLSSRLGLIAANHMRQGVAPGDAYFSTMGIRGHFVGSLPPPAARIPITVPLAGKFYRPFNPMVMTVSPKALRPTRENLDGTTQSARTPALVCSDQKTR
jgi:hypothetical protein